MRFVNLTPHAVNVHNPDGSVIAVEPSGVVARCEEGVRHIDVLHMATIGVVEVKRLAHGTAYDVPSANADKDARYIVSRLVRETLHWRSDVLSPGGLVRDDKGAVVGCRYLVCN